jgi:hypothetical protein
MTYRDGRLAYKLRKGFYKKEKAKNETKWIHSKSKKKHICF